MNTILELAMRALDFILSVELEETAWEILWWAWVVAGKLHIVAGPFTPWCLLARELVVTLVLLGN